MDYSKEVKTVFIVGVGRSGTSLLQSMLDAHPKGVFLPETHFFRKYVAARKYRSKIEKKGVKALMQILKSDDDFGRAGIAAEELLMSSEQEETPLDLEKVYKRLLKLYLKGYQDLQFVGDKDPRNIDYLQSLKTAFPNAKILHIVRDPRDVLSSRMKAEWSKHRPVWQHVLLYETQLKRGRRLGKQLFGNNYYEFRYEDLIAQPEKSLQAISRHLEIEYSEAMLKFSKSAERLVDKNEMSWKKETLGPLLKENKNKWKKSLNLRQIAMAEQVCTTAFKDFGYSYSNSKNSRGLLSYASPLFSSLYQLRLNAE